MAKVSNAASASASGLQWFKVAEDGLDGSGNWGVDRMISSGGWTEFTLPTCLASGQYLLRAEIIALHNAGSSGGAQFYIVSHPKTVYKLASLTLCIGMRPAQRFGLRLKDWNHRQLPRRLQVQRPRHSG